MTSVEEAINRVVGFTPHPLREMMMECVYEALLAVHFEACDESSGDGYNGPWSFCGDKDFQIWSGGKQTPMPDNKIWYCEVAKKYLP